MFHLFYKIEFYSNFTFPLSFVEFCENLFSIFTRTQEYLQPKSKDIRHMNHLIQVQQYTGKYMCSEYRY